MQICNPLRRPTTVVASEQQLKGFVDDAERFCETAQRREYGTAFFITVDAFNAAPSQDTFTALSAAYRTLEHGVVFGGERMQAIVKAKGLAEQMFKDIAPPSAIIPTPVREYLVHARNIVAMVRCLNGRIANDAETLEGKNATAEWGAQLDVFFSAMESAANVVELGDLHDDVACHGEFETLFPAFDEAVESIVPTSTDANGREEDVESDDDGADPPILVLTETLEVFRTIITTTVKLRDDLRTAAWTTVCAEVKAVLMPIHREGSGGSDGTSWKANLPDECGLDEAMSASAPLFKTRGLGMQLKGYKKTAAQQKHTVEKSALAIKPRVGEVDKLIKQLTDGMATISITLTELAYLQLLKDKKTEHGPKALKIKMVMDKQDEEEILDKDLHPGVIRLAKEAYHAG